jgi:hypothetical protein
MRQHRKHPPGFAFAILAAALALTLGTVGTGSAEPLAGGSVGGQWISKAASGPRPPQANLDPSAWVIAKSPRVSSKFTEEIRKSYAAAPDLLKGWLILNNVQLHLYSSVKEANALTGHNWPAHATGGVVGYYDHPAGSASSQFTKAVADDVLTANELHKDAKMRPWVEHWAAAISSDFPMFTFIGNSAHVIFPSTNQVEREAYERIFSNSMGVTRQFMADHYLSGQTAPSVLSLPQAP